MTTSPALTAIQQWQPTLADTGDPRTSAIVVATRQVVAAADPAHVDQAQIAAGYVFRFLMWATRDGDAVRDALVTLDAVDEYVAYLKSTGVKSGSANSARSYLRRCAVEASGLQHRAPRTNTSAVSSVSERIDTYVPDPLRVSPGLWEQIAETVRGAVTADNPRAWERASLLLTVTALYGAWATAEHIPDSGLFEPGNVERFIEVGRTAWAEGTAPTYASALRSVARANAPGIWPRRPSKETAAPMEPYSSHNLASIARAIDALPSGARREHIEASFILGYAAGIIGIEAALARPSDVVADEPVTIRVRGKRSRVVPVAENEAARLVELAELATQRGDIYLIGGRNQRDDRQSILWNQFAGHGTVVDPQRLLLTWRIELVQMPLPLRAVLDLTGLKTFETLADAVAVAGPYDEARAFRVASRRQQR